MKKFLLALAVIVPMVLVGCSSAENDARNQIAKRMDVFIKEDASFSIGDCIYSKSNDSCFIFSGDVTDVQGKKYNVEYIFNQYKNDLLVGIQAVEVSGSLLRNMNTKANTGSEIDDAVNEAFASSELGLSMTIYNDLKNGSLLDITDISNK